MNKELIQLFLIQACWDGQDQHELEDWLNVEQFAELIVRECASICLDMKYTNPQPHHYAVMIKEHFGVKE